MNTQPCNAFTILLSVSMVMRWDSSWLKLEWCLTMYIYTHIHTRDQFDWNFTNTFYFYIKIYCAVSVLLQSLDSCFEKSQKMYKKNRKLSECTRDMIVLAFKFYLLVWNIFLQCKLVNASLLSFNQVKLFEFYFGSCSMITNCWLK